MKCQAFTKYHWVSVFSSCQLSKCKRFVAGLSVFLSEATRSSYCFGYLHFGISIGFKKAIVWGCALVYSESNTMASKAIWRLFSGHNLSQKITILCKKTHFKCVKEVPSGIRLWKEDAPSQVSVAGAASPQKKISKDFREPLQGHMWGNKKPWVAFRCCSLPGWEFLKMMLFPKLLMEWPNVSSFSVDFWIKTHTNKATLHLLRPVPSRASNIMDQSAVLNWDVVKPNMVAFLENLLGPAYTLYQWENHHRYFSRVRLLTFMIQCSSVLEGSKESSHNFARSDVVFGCFHL